MRTFLRQDHARLQLRQGYAYAYSMIRTRFAPSPNGPLHLGHAYAAIVAHDLARERLNSGQGAFLVRIEDIDGARSHPHFADSILEDLEWLGLKWDAPLVYQSSRLPAYAQAAEALKQQGLLYPCRCTRAEILAAAHEYGPDGPIYPGTCKHRDTDENGASWRLDVAAAINQAGQLKWTDELAGTQIAKPELFGDVVIVRKDNPASYHLAATLDDATDGITLITRGQDLFDATHIHRLLQELLGLPVPRWHHHALLVEHDGRKLAKRRGSPSLADRRLAGEDGLKLAEELRSGSLPSGISFSAGVKAAL